MVMVPKQPSSSKDMESLAITPPPAPTIDAPGDTDLHDNMGINDQFGGSNLSEIKRTGKV